MIEPSVLSWSVVMFILLTGWLAAYREHLDDEE
jgi:hypothetical protein